MDKLNCKIYPTFHLSMMFMGGMITNINLKNASAFKKKGWKRKQKRYK